MANRTPVAVPTRPRTTEAQATDSPGSRASAPARRNSHAGLVATSVRSGAEKTGPLPASRFSTTRKVMNASSAVQRVSQPATTTPSTVTPRSTRSAAPLRSLPEEVRSGTSGSATVAALAVGEEAEEVVAVAALAERFGRPHEARVVQPAVAPGDLLDAADLQALALLDHRHELGGLAQRRSEEHT